MAVSVISVLEQLNSRLADMEALQENLKEKIRVLEQENDALKTELREREAIVANQALDIEYLKISHKLADSVDNIASARQMIARLIRTIDSCISLVKEE